MPALVVGASALVAKYFVEWDRDTDFDRGIASPAASRDYAYATRWAAVVSAADAGNYSALVPFQYQITGLDTGAVYHVRVSAYSSEGYGPAATSGNQLSAVTQIATLGPPTGCAMNVSGSPGSVPHLGQFVDAPSRLDVYFEQPLEDTRGFKSDTATYNPEVASGYRPQWSTDPEFVEIDGGSYDWAAACGEGNRILAETGAGAYVPLGAEVQTLAVYSGTADLLADGSYYLLYLGPTSTTFRALAKRSSRTLVSDSNATASECLAAGDFCRVSGELYKIAAVVGRAGSSNVTLATVYAGGDDGAW